MNEGTKRSEYIGRAVVGEYGVFQQMDQEYAHHFYQKQLMTVKNDSTYAQYIREEQEKNKKQLGRFKEVYENTTTRTKKDVMYYLRIVKERVKENFKGIIDSEKGKQYRRNVVGGCILENIQTKELRYKKAFKEIYLIINNLAEELYSKIPKGFIELIKNNMDLEYNISLE